MQHGHQGKQQQNKTNQDGQKEHLVGDLLNFRATVLRARNQRRKVRHSSQIRASAFLEPSSVSLLEDQEDQDQEEELSDFGSRSPSPRPEHSTDQVMNQKESVGKMDNDVLASVTEYKEKIKADGEELVLKHFPKKVLELDALVKSELFSKLDLSEVNVDLNIPVPAALTSVTANISNNHELENTLVKKRKFDAIDGDIPSGTKVFVLPNGTVPCNKHIVKLVNIAKPHMRQLVEDASSLKMWIQFLIPRIEDGNNFGVSIQEDVLGEIRNVESDAAVYFDQISRYFMTRAKIISKVAKYPHVEDYRRTIQELDEKEYLSMRLVLIDLRNHYSNAHDLITKNLEKIKKPRTSNSDTMY